MPSSTTTWPHPAAAPVRDLKPAVAEAFFATLTKARLLHDAPEKGMGDPRRG
jgi:hypothetical protein